MKRLLLAACAALALTTSAHAAELPAVMQGVWCVTNNWEWGDNYVGMQRRSGDGCKGKAYQVEANQVIVLGEAICTLSRIRPGEPWNGQPTASANGRCGYEGDLRPRRTMKVNHMVFWFEDNSELWFKWEDDACPTTDHKKWA